ncbi:odorant receptor 9a-like [Prorops nasuta]|uniref:odorant receptor 9a-like n=1 Tax=Prorops nasuta TaxID=863751 RepID=UPI0034CF5D2E
MINLSRFYDKDVLSWSQRLLGFSGLWPEVNDDRRFFCYISYVIIFTLLLFVTLIQNLNDLEKTMINTTLFVPTLLIVLKALMFRWKMSLLLPLLSTVRNNVMQGLFQGNDERETVFLYNIFSTMFSMSSALSLFLVPTMFYSKPVVGCILSKFNSCSLPYEIPLEIYPIYEIRGMQNYVIFCICLIPASTFLTVGATGADSLLVSLTFYICGQFSVLNSRIQRVPTDQDKYYRKMRSLIERHTHLLRMATILGDAFSSLMFIQTLGLIFSLCIVGYQLLTVTQSGEDLNTIHFIIYACAVVLLAFCYCFLGECLIQESIAINNAIYSSNWYELPPEWAKSLMICILRARKPPTLHGGKFYEFSLETFGVIMKASLAYLSVLKTIT